MAAPLNVERLARRMGLLNGARGARAGAAPAFRAARKAQARRGKVRARKIAANQRRGDRRMSRGAKSSF